MTTELNYMDSILHVCDKNNVEPEEVKKYLNNNIVEHVEAEARALNFLPRMNTLDIQGMYTNIKVYKTYIACYNMHTILKYIVNTI